MKGLVTGTHEYETSVGIISVVWVVAMLTVQSNSEGLRTKTNTIFQDDNN